MTYARKWVSDLKTEEPIGKTEMGLKARFLKRAKPVFGVFLALCLVALTFLPPPLLATGASSGVGPAQLQALKAQVERIRGIRAPDSVRLQYLSRSGLREKVLENLREEKSQKELTSAEEIMKMLGLIPPDLDLAKLLVELYTEQVGGFYDSEDDALYLVADAAEMNVMDRLTMAHELVHFLQDHRFRLDRAPFSDKDEEVDDDRLFAASCLVEGDAMLTSQLWARDHLSPHELMQLGELSRRVPTDVLDRAPRYVRESLLFPYQGGMEFVARLYRKGGFAAVDRAFEDPPRSSEEVMHPDKYLSGERPLEVDIPPLGLEGWEKAYENVLGEFDVYQLFSLFIPDHEAKRAAEGWNGNRYAYFRVPEGGQVLACVFLWDSALDAEEFIVAFQSHLESRFGGRLNPRVDQGWKLVEVGGYFYAWDLKGERARLIQTNSHQALEQVKSALGGTEGEPSGDEREPEKTRDVSGWRFTAVAALVASLFVLGLLLAVFILVSYRRRPKP